jgi:glycine oxidase
MSNHPSDVLIVGAGVIGLGIAWRCRQRGLSVTVVDPAPGSGASSTAAGMLAPVTELNYGEVELLRLGIESSRRYPAFAAELEAASGLSIGYRACGTVVAAWDGADIAALRDLHAFQTSLGLSAELITGRELRTLEPALAPGLPGGLFAADDHQVDNRLLHAALLSVVGPIVTESVVSLVRSGSRVTGVQLADGRLLSAGSVVLAAGAWSARLFDVPIRPVKGQTLRLRSAPLLTHIVRGSVKGSRVYIVPRANGEIVVGASSEETGFDLHPRAGAIYELLRDAQSLVPALGEAEFVEVSTSLRPAAPDNAPIIGPSEVDGLVLAVGHYRNGILLTPITADLVADQLTADVDAR